MRSSLPLGHMCARGDARKVAEYVDRRCVHALRAGGVSPPPPTPLAEYSEVGGRGFPPRVLCPPPPLIAPRVKISVSTRWEGAISRGGGRARIRGDAREYAGEKIRSTCPRRTFHGITGQNPIAQDGGRRRLDNHWLTSKGEVLPVLSRGGSLILSIRWKGHQVKYLSVPQSGSLAGQTASRNRYGQYLRTRAMPVNPNSTPQSQARSRLAGLAEIWDLLTDVQRAGWTSLGQSMTRTDSLGQQYSLTGMQAYISVNSTNLTAGNAVVSAAPALSTPASLTSITITLTSAAFSIAYTATPLGAGARAFLFASPQRSAGRSFESDYRLIAVTAAAAASPANIFTAYSARLGTPVTGNKIFTLVQVYTLGFLSAPILGATVIA